MSIELNTLRRYVKQCEPERPLQAGDPLYVPLDEGIPVRGEQTCIDRLSQTIALADFESCQLFTGFPGTGKTTELKRLEARLSGSKDLPTHVIYVDFEEYVDRYTPISITDVLRVIAYCMDRDATIAEGRDPDQHPGYLKRFFSYLSQADPQIKEIGFEAYGASLMLEIRNNPTFHQKAEAALQGRFQQFAAEAKDAMSQAVVRLRKGRGAYAERVVVIADGLEKLTPLREEDRGAMEASVETLFLTHRDFLQLPCHAIYTFPLWLRFRSAQLGTGYRREPLVLPMVKVSEPDGAAYEPGIEKMMEIVRRRIEDLPGIFGLDPAAVLRPLIEASGGYPRDLLRMVRNLLLDATDFPATPKQVNRAIDEVAASYSNMILGTYVDILAHVATTHELATEDAGELGLFSYLTERWLILAYRNGMEWYDLHPLVRRSSKIQKRLAELNRR
jgi:hypothetical protein